MIDPKKPIALLPHDREIMAMAGMSEQEYRAFVKHCFNSSKIQPGLPVNFEIITFIVTLVVGLALSYLATLLTPKPNIPGEKESPQTKQVNGQNIVRGTEYAPQTGFDAPQNVVELSSIVPLVYSQRTRVDDRWFGGVRINTNLIWSQVMTMANNQMLRAIFLVGEGAEEMAIDPTQFAIGNNLLRSYDLSPGSRTSRLSIYWRNNGGRIVELDNIAGRTYQQDPGNAMNEDADDVYMIRSEDDKYKADFCMAAKPSSQTALGLYGFVGNGFAYKVNPRYRPNRDPQIASNNGELICQEDPAVNEERRKQRQRWPEYSGLIGTKGIRTVEVGDSLTYVISDYSVIERDDSGGGDRTDGTDQVINLDVAQAVASRQKEYDQNIEVGSLYKIGSAQAVCVARTPEDKLFQSMADLDPIGPGQSITAEFEVTAPGSVEIVAANEEEMKGNAWKGDLRNATQRGHIYKIATANVSIERRAKVVEFSFRSQLATSLSGMCNFRNVRYGEVKFEENSDGNGDCADGWERVVYGEQFYDMMACLRWNDLDWDDIADEADGAAFERYESDTITTKEKRYSFFRLSYRNAAADEKVEWTTTSKLYGFCSERATSIYNWLRIEFPTEQRWSVRFVPVSGWEIRQNIEQGELWVLDSTLDNPQMIIDSGLTLHTSGYRVDRTLDTFRMLTLQPPDQVDVNNGMSDPCEFGIEGAATVHFDDETFYGDAWARLAEEFYFNDISTSASSPEHEIVNVNIITENNPVPDYHKLATVGLNIRSSLELSKLEQFSVYMNRGLGQSLLQLDESAHHFPDVLYDLLTSKRYGVGSILSRELIDLDSFKEAHRFCDKRRYFFDGAITEKVNVRSWATEAANNNLLDLCISGGRFALKPVVNFYGPEKVTGLFTAGNIIEDTFKLSYIDQRDRLAPIITVRWREERESGGDNKKGLFPVVREVTVRETDVSDLAPVTQIDMTQYCTSLEQAIDRAKYECRYRRMVTHTVALKTVPSEANVQVGSIIKVGMETVSYDQPRNGAVDGRGRVTTWGPTPNGKQKCLVWDGATRQVTEEEIVFDGEFADRTNCVFCLADSKNKAEGYKVMKVGFDEDGNVDIEAIYWPLDEDDRSMIVKGWDLDSNWLIEGINYEG